MNGNNIGSLLVNARYANGGAPVAGAKMTLRRDGEYIGEYYLGGDGKSDGIILEPGEYSVSVTAPGFADSGEYVFPVMKNITTLQNVSMFPNSGGGEGEI